MQDAEAIFNYNGEKFSCTALIGRTVLFFGGYHETRQISQLTPLGLLRIGTLPFAFYKGTCLVMENQLFLGLADFEKNDKNCWSR